MYTLLWLVPALPLAGFVILALVGGALPKRVAAILGVGTVGLSALLTLIIGASYLAAPPPDGAFTQTLWKWMEVGSFNPAIALRLDGLSLVMMFVVTFVGFWIHLYSTEYMQDDEGYSRFFAYLNLFVSAMLVLVLADNLLLLYLGWEGVGLCSYLLIGFWYKNPANGYAARKAFVVTRVGDTAMAIGLFLLFTQLGTLEIQPLMQNAAQQWPVGTPLAAAAAALLLGGAVGKSAQLPLQTWLPDAMAGPTPVSALIHAATMVTAGVYLIARTHVLFELAPGVMLVVGIVGALTLLTAGFSAVAQTDLKRVLAYSTISQIGYMFLALGVGAWPAAIFHLFTHAFFKALLFLGAGAVIHALDQEQELHKMGGLRRELPLTFWTFLIGAASLSALPLVTAGFYSKDLILSRAFAAPAGGTWLWAAGLFGAFLTALYTFRMVFLTFFGEAKSRVHHKPALRMQLPLVILAVLSIIGGFVELPPWLGNMPLFSRLLETSLAEGVLPLAEAEHLSAGMEAILALAAAAAAAGGIALAYFLYMRRAGTTDGLMRSPSGMALNRLWYSGWGFDWLYNNLFVRPYVWLAKVNKDDIVDALYDGVAWLFGALNRALSLTQNGRLRWYAVGVTLGAIVLIGMAVLL